MGAEEVKAMMRDGRKVFYHDVQPQEREGHTLGHKLVSYKNHHNEMRALTSLRSHFRIFEASRQEPCDIRDRRFNSLDSGKVGEQERVVCF